MKRTSWPLLIFVLLIILFVFGLLLNPRHIPSPLVGQMAPSLKGQDFISGEWVDMQNNNQAWLLNAWASWCRGCYIEHPHLLELAQQHDVLLIGLNYKDQSADAQAWLSQHGNPYHWIIEDPSGQIGLDWGLIGTPETFLIDAQGRVRDKWMGALTPERIEQQVLPAWQKIQQEGLN